MYGAAIGDIVGSKYEFDNIHTKAFPFVSADCDFTDDTVMTVAVAKALMQARAENKPFQPLLVQAMQDFGRRYPGRGYGGRFGAWLYESDPKPYNSYGNGAAMRVSPCGLIAVTMEEALALAKASAEVTHDHPEGIKGAQATAAAVYLAKTGRSKEEIASYVRAHYYPLDETLAQIRTWYYFNETCQETVPQAIQAFLEADSFEDAIRNAVSIGGDSDTVAAITGSIAWSYYRFNDREPGWTRSDAKPGRVWTEDCTRVIAENGIDEVLPKEFLTVMEDLDILRMERCGVYERTGFCREIPLLRQQK